MSATCSHFSVLRQGKTTLTLRITNKQGGVISKGRPDLCTTQCPLFTGGVRGSGFNAVQFWLVFRITSIVTSSHLDVQLWNAREHWNVFGTQSRNSSTQLVQNVFSPEFFLSFLFFWTKDTHINTAVWFFCWGWLGGFARVGWGVHDGLNPTTYLITHNQAFA